MCNYFVRDVKVPNHVRPWCEQFLRRKCCDNRTDIVHDPVPRAGKKGVAGVFR